MSILPLFVLTAGAVTSTTSGYWTNTTTWGGSVPGAGEDVVISSSHTVTADVSTASLNSLTNNGTLVFVGTNTAITSTTVMVTGLVTHLAQSALSTNVSGQWDADHRIWLVCTDLTIATNGRINADGKGWRGGTNHASGKGPGGGGFNTTNNMRGGGGGYGGGGGVGNEYNGGVPGLTYGQPSSPQPGSGGAGGRLDNTDGYGGGLVWLDISGAATIHGVVSANGNPHNDAFGETGGGSGGGIYLSCDTLAGSGAIRANGGSGLNYGGAGGGGRIAILANNATGWIGHVQLRKGLSSGSAGYNSGEHGTLYATNPQMLPTSATSNDVWRAHGISSWAPPSLLLNRAELAFEVPSLTLAITNDLTITNQGILVFGVPNTTNRMTVTVGGNLLITNTAGITSLTFYAASTNGAEETGATLTVGGATVLAPGGFISLWSHVTNGGSSKITTRDLTVAAGARIEADYKGWKVDQGPGKGGVGAGGGYGGQGGSNAWPGVTAGGGTYGSSNAPTLPGSGGGSNNGRFVGHGGGLVWIDVTNGTTLINGSLSAIGASDPADRGGAGSGGGIYLTTSYLYGTGLVTAAGGGTPQYSGGGGAGGRIAVGARYFYHSLTTSVAGGPGGADGGYNTAGQVGTIVWGQRPAAPLVSNLAPSSVDYFTATINGRVTTTGTAPATVSVFWGTNDWATNLDLWTGTNEFGGSRTNGEVLSLGLTGLSTATRYYYRFYGSNDVGTSWTESATNFRTLAGIPVVSNAPGGATAVTLTSATLNGILASTGTASTVISVYWGPVDGGTNAGLWGQTNTWAGFVSPGAFATNVNLSSSNICYYYTFTASNADGMVWATPSSAFIGGNVSVSAVDPNAVEKGPSKTGQFTVSRSATATNIPLTVFYTLGGTASNGIDYEFLSGSVLLSAGASNVAVTVVPLMDSTSDDGETVILSLIDGNYGIGSPSLDTVTIQDSVPSSSNVWTGTGNWASYTNWSDEMMPIAGQSTYVSAGNVTITQSPPILPLLSVGATLTFGATSTVITATDISVTGTITHLVNADTNGLDGWTPNATITLVCTNLTILSSGSIAVKGKGWQGGVSSNSGCGPGGGPNRDIRGNGASHGGYGGTGSVGPPGSPGPLYDSIGDPLLPGSGGGGGRLDNTGAAGGGCVRVQATGTITLNGVINADGNSWADANQEGGGGSGGSIALQCNSLTGSGALRASGGSTTYGGSGGGGCISIAANTATGWTGYILMKPGTSTFGGGTPEKGTLYTITTDVFPLIADTNDAWRAYGISSWSPSSFTLNNSDLVFEAPSLALTVTNSLVVTNQSRLVFGTPNTTNRYTIQIGGNLAISNTSVLTLYATATNGSDICGASIALGGTLSIATGAVLYPVSHSTNGGSVKITAQGIAVASGGVINADGAGWRVDNGPGKAGAGAGGGYGGIGGSANWPGFMAGGPTYGSSNAPTMPGSGGGSANGRFVGHGGGLIWIEATRDASIDGTLTANGGSDTIDRGGAGSGGGIYLRCRQFLGAGSLLAKGGDTPLYSGGGGGGGRIAVWSIYDGFTGTATASGGDGYDADGLPGTVIRGRVSPPGTVFVVH